MGISLTDDMSTAAEHITYWAHKDHPLILFDEHKRNNTNEVKRMEDQMICNACVSPIVSSSFYGCAECNFFIHRFCVELPEELHHPSHPEHKLVRGQFLEPYNYFECNFCKKCCNGIFFYCETCTFYIDIGCASLPNKIKHEAHKHPLNQLKISRCSGSENKFFGLGFGCEKCNYYLDNNHTFMPGTVRHRWDPHPIPLTYPPVKNHPDLFYCEIWEEEINTNFWLYFCRECDQSFHTSCIRPDDSYSNIKYGATIKVDNMHPHGLTFAPNKKQQAMCGSCGEDIDDGEPVLECATCTFLLTVECACSDQI